MNSANSQQGRSRYSHQDDDPPFIVKPGTRASTKIPRLNAPPAPASPVKRTSRYHHQPTRREQGGFSLSETVVAAAAGAVLITGGAIALRTISSSMQHSGDLSG